MQLKENTLYCMRDGRIVGPLSSRDGGTWFSWEESTYDPATLAFIPMWKPNGRWDAFMDYNTPRLDIVKEVGYATL